MWRHDITYTSLLATCGWCSSIAMDTVNKTRQKLVQFMEAVPCTNLANFSC